MRPNLRGRFSGERPSGGRVQAVAGGLEEAERDFLAEAEGSGGDAQSAGVRSAAPGMRQTRNAPSLRGPRSGDVEPGHDLECGCKRAGWTAAGRRMKVFD
jgi:hypothetical protein